MPIPLHDACMHHKSKSKTNVMERLCSNGEIEEIQKHSQLHQFLTILLFLFVLCFRPAKVARKTAEENEMAAQDHWKTCPPLMVIPIPKTSPVAARPPPLPIKTKQLKIKRHKEGRKIGALTVCGIGKTTNSFLKFWSTFER